MECKSKKSDRKSQEPYGFTHRWDVKLNATKEQELNKENLIDTDNSVLVTYHRLSGEVSGRRGKRVNCMVMEELPGW